MKKAGNDLLPWINPDNYKDMPLWTCFLLVGIALACIIMAIIEAVKLWIE